MDNLLNFIDVQNTCKLLDMNLNNAENILSIFIKNLKAIF